MPPVGAEGLPSAIDARLGKVRILLELEFGIGALEQGASSSLSLSVVVSHPASARNTSSTSVERGPGHGCRPRSCRVLASRPGRGDQDKREGAALEEETAARVAALLD
jgi:hypothetical protein